MSAGAPTGAASATSSLLAAFFAAVSFDEGAEPAYDGLHALFVERGLLVRAATGVPEAAGVREFIEPRRALVRSGRLKRFREWEISAREQAFGNVAHRFSVYGKSALLDGVATEARGMISTQFVRGPQGWRITVMAWDDERPGLAVPER